MHSTDLLSWRIATTVLVPNDGLTWEQSLWMTGYHYAGRLRWGRCLTVSPFVQLIAAPGTVTPNDRCLQWHSIRAAQAWRMPPPALPDAFLRPVRLLAPPTTDWVVDGPDILAAVRTAYDGAHSFHDS